MSNTPPAASDEQVAAAWQRIKDDVDALVEKGANEVLWPVRPGSSMWADDRASNPWHCSTAAHSALSASLDHLHGLTTLIFEGHALHSRAPYTLARGCIENAAVALWLVHPPKRTDRVFRAMKWYATDVIDGDTAVTEVGISVPRSKEARLQDLVNTARAAGCAVEDSIAPLKPTQILRYADSQSSPGALTPLFSWRLCSGFSHGRMWASLGLLENEEQSTDEHGVISMRQTNSLDRVLYPAQGGYELLKLASHTFERRAAP